MNITRVETELIAIKKQLFSINANTTSMGELRSCIDQLDLKLEHVRDKIGSTNIILEEMLRIMKAKQNRLF